MVELHNKLVVVRHTNSPEVSKLRNKLVTRLAGDLEDLEFKLRDVFRVLESHEEYIHNLNSFERFHGAIDYEGDLVKMVADFLMETAEIIVLQSQSYSGLVEEFDGLQARLAEETQDCRDTLRLLHVEYDHHYFSQYPTPVNDTEFDTKLNEIQSNLTERGDKLVKNERDEYGLSVIFKQVLRSYLEGIPHLLQLLRANFLIMQDVVAQSQGSALSAPSRQQPLFNKDKPLPYKGEKRRYM